MAFKKAINVILSVSVSIFSCQPVKRIEFQILSKVLKMQIFRLLYAKLPSLHQQFLQTMQLVIIIKTGILLNRYHLETTLLKICLS